MSQTARWIGLIAAIGMLIFSGYVYMLTGDWVAIVFLLGSVAYVVFFYSTGRKDDL
ncbi:MAG: hypothetical protein AAGA91_15870 [Pseudomonadota bacterium]